MPTIQVADKPTLDWIKNKFYKTVCTATATNTVVATLVGEQKTVTLSGTHSIIGDKYTVLGDGTYRISIKISNTSGNVYLDVFKNDMLLEQLYSGNTTSSITKNMTISAKKGDVIDIRGYGAGATTLNVNLLTVGTTYSYEQVEMNLEDFEDKEYNNTMGGYVGTKSSSPTTINGKGVITLIGLGKQVYFSVDGGNEQNISLPSSASFVIYFNERITVYSESTLYVAQTI